MDKIDTPKREKPTLLADFVYQHLHQAILSGVYAPDKRLPSENTLAKEFDVSRPVVRDALGRLREEGLVYSRQGSGSFVRATSQLKPLAFSPLETIADLQRCYEFRLTIEPVAAALAAERRSTEALADIEAALKLLRDATQRRSHREDADFGFHRAIAAAANNQYFEAVMQALKDHIAVGMKFHGLSLQGIRGGFDHVLEEHAAIFEAIRSGDAEAARTAMHAHVVGSRDRLFEGRLLDLSSKRDLVARTGAAGVKNLNGGQGNRVNRDSGFGRAPGSG
jgi:GntR family transcriptional repressor for pyruvate dehydrogenase complex